MEPTDGTLRIGRSPDGQRFGRFLIGPTVLVLNACKSPQEVEEVLRKIGLYPSRVEVEDQRAEAERCATAIQSMLKKVVDGRTLQTNAAGHTVLDDFEHFCAYSGCDPNNAWAKLAFCQRPVTEPMIPPINHDDLMLATLHPAPFSRENWIFELKYDGFRCLVRKVGSRVELLSRNGKPLNRSFPDIAAAIERLPGSFVWDAELTVDEVTGRSSFERLQLRARTSMAMRVREAARLHPARLYVFDLLAAGARDLRELPLIQRKEMLRDTFDDAAALIYVTGVVTAGAWVFEQAVRHDFEGMIGKRLDSPYQRGRSNYWHQVKNQGYSRPAALG